jgi:hypothetical protein
MQTTLIGKYDRMHQHIIAIFLQIFHDISHVAFYSMFWYLGYIYLDWLSFTELEQWYGGISFHLNEYTIALFYLVPSLIVV